MAKGQGTFGHKELAEQFTKRIKKHFRRNKISGESSLVIGVFGEWGSGKSNLLELIKAEFQKETEAEQQTDKQLEQAPIIVVPFNPWRYEKEEHLLVPLIKTMQFEVHHYHQANKKITGQIADKLTKLITFLGASTIAFARGFKGKVGLPANILEIEYDHDIAVKALDEELKRANIDESPLQQLNSYYYEFEKKLQDLTSGEDSVRLLLLIDDLDRCLPEKAVEMLESIKLFLDVEGCAFVLALDDEVVERGIIHRYRDYLFQGNGTQNENTSHSSHPQLPITGIEYLEKIIQLPFRLPQPSESEIRVFLQEKYPDLFGLSVANEFHGEMQDGIKSGSTSGKNNKISHQSPTEKNHTDSTELLDLFVNHIPAVPRKQIRAAELLQLLLDMAKSRQCEGLIQKLPLAKLTLLQIFAPDLYRFGRRKYVGFMTLLEEWSEQEYWRYKDHFHNLIKIRYEIEAIENNITLENTQRCLPSIVKQIQDDNKARKQEALRGEQRLYHRYYRELIETFEKASHNRSGFDLYRFVATAKIDQIDLSPYYTLVDEKQKQPPRSETSLEIELEVASIGDQDEFLDLLFSESEGSWQSAMHRTELNNKVIDNELFKAISSKLNDGFDSFKNNAKWLAYLCPHLSTLHFERLLEDTDTFKPIFATENTSDQASANEDKAHLLNALRVEQRTLLSEQSEAIEAHYLEQMTNENKDVKDRAKAGRLLDKLDQRKGVAIRKDSQNTSIPDIDWVPIPSGSFKMGSDDEESYADEQPIHPVTVPGFQMARYPVTNAQYRCFVEAGGYDDDELWGKLPEAASWWLEGGEADQKLLESIKDKDDRERYKNWLAEDTVRNEPRFWNDDKWNRDNHPVVGISWFEALAYCQWLNDRQAEVLDSGLIVPNSNIRLATEEEWEYAARGSENFKYAWGKDADKLKGNYADTDLMHTSPVGMFPEGKAFGLQDMSGNVWEWTSSRWGNDFSDPSYQYKDWSKEQVAERNDINPVEFRVIRGGSWVITSRDVRCAIRNGDPPSGRSYRIGFRMVYGVLPG